MGKPIKIAKLAEDLIRFSGKEPGKDVEIVYTGLRPGEKLYEELITEGEGIVPTNHEKIMVLQMDGDWYGHESREAFKKWLWDEVNELREFAEKRDAKGIRKKMKEIVPEYQSTWDPTSEA